MKKFKIKKSFFANNDIFWYIFSFDVTFSAAAANPSASSPNQGAASQQSQTTPNTNPNIQFCICTADKSSCNTKKYNLKTDCDADRVKQQTNSGTSGSFACVQVDSSKECSSLSQATTNSGQNTGSSSGTTGDTNNSTSGSTATGNSGSNYLGDLTSEIQGLNRLKSDNIQQFLGGAIKTLLGILGSIALAMIVYGGFLFMTSGGNSDKKKKSVGILVWSALGIAIIFSSYAVTNFILDVLR